MLTNCWKLFYFIFSSGDIWFDFPFWNWSVIDLLFRFGSYRTNSTFLPRVVNEYTLFFPHLYWYLKTSFFWSGTFFLSASNIFESFLKVCCFSWNRFSNFCVDSKFPTLQNPVIQNSSLVTDLIFVRNFRSVTFVFLLFWC